MPQIELMIRNKPPLSKKDAPEAELGLFRKFIDVQTAYPYEHQCQAFESIRQGQNITMVAGTAAGKTLAVAVPLFVKLSKGLANKIMFLYPTIALMEDQKAVMEKLADLTNMQDEIGVIQGGLSRTALIRNLSKKILLATPDSVYWFFRKNVKYNSIMIYGLSQIDEYVLDEAHLFSGLMLNNLRFFFKRIEILQKQFLRRDIFHLHILTATPHEELFTLNSGRCINGKSKCGDVKAIFYNASPYEKAEDFQNLVNRALEGDFKKILVICNSAAVAHRLFQQYAGKIKDNGVFTPQHYMQFGCMKRSQLEEALKQAGIEDELIQRLERVSIEDAAYRFGQFREVTVEVSASDVFETLQSIIKKLKGQMMQILYLIFRNRKDYSYKLPYDELRYHIGKRNEILKRMFETMVKDREPHDYMEWKQILDEALNHMLEQIEENLAAAEPIILQWPSLDTLPNLLAGIDDAVIKAVIVRLKDEFSFYYSNIRQYKGKFPKNGDPYIYLKWLWNYFETDTEKVKEALLALLTQNPDIRNIIEMRHVAFAKGSDYPLIVYSGSMSKQSREGLINLFDDLDKAVLVSTSAVEVGVDFAADLLITEQCEAGSFLQRFGRIGRTGNALSEAWVLVEGGAFGDIRDKAGDFNAEMSREDFSTLINESFGYRVHIWQSILGEASYSLINDQLGAIGKDINRQSPISEAAVALANELESNDIVPAYGLRSTMPSIALKDAGVTRDAFYVLQYIEDRRLKKEDSDFEMASADMYFNELLWCKKNWRIGLDVDRMLEETRAVFVWNGTKLEICTGNDIGKKMYNVVCRMAVQRPAMAIMLAYGDIYLRRYDIGEEGGAVDIIKDKYEIPLTIPEQFYVILPKRIDVTELKKRGLYGIDEIYYDVDYKGQSLNGRDIALLDRIQGACIAFYIQWMKEVNEC